MVTHRLAATCDGEPVLCEHNPVVVASCGDLQKIAPSTTGCREDRAAWIGSPNSGPGTWPITLELRGLSQDGLATGPVLTNITLDKSDVITLPELMVDRVNGWIVVPPALPGVAQAASTHGQPVVAITADPQRALFETLLAAGLHPSGFWDTNEMHRIQRTTDGIRLLGAVVLLLGLLSCVIGALDRAIERRREVVRLQLMGVPARVLVLSHWLEVALPLLLGTTLALDLGWVAAESYLP